MNANQGVLAPCDALGLVRVGVGEALDLARLASEQTVKIGPDLVAGVLLQRVALRASCLRLVISGCPLLGSALP